MSDIERVLAEKCFEPDAGGKWLSNGYQRVRLDPDGLWQVFQLVAEGRTAEALREAACHPRWLDEDGFVIHPAPKLTDKQLRRRIARLPTEALRREASAALDRGEGDRAKTILVRNRLL